MFLNLVRGEWDREESLALSLMLAVMQQGGFGLPKDPPIEAIYRRGGLASPSEEETQSMMRGLSRIWEDPTSYPVAVRGRFLIFKKQEALLASIEKSVRPLLPIIPIHICSFPPFLNDSQKHVFSDALKRPLSLILGGPGTGKTFTAAALISHLCEINPSLKIACAAPTGKAAHRLKEGLKRGSIQSQTLHQLLGIGKDPLDTLPVLPQDLIVVDEASMIDSQMMAILLDKIPPKGRLILIGDPDQLPPVDGGSPFRYLADFFLRQGWTKRLTASERIKNSSLHAVVEALRNGDQQNLEEVLLPHLIDTDRASPSKIRELIIEKSLTGTKVLSCYREGPIGVTSINSFVFEKAIERGIKRFPISIAKNQPQQNLWNGETGWVEVPHRLSSSTNLRTVRGAEASVGDWKGHPSSLPPFDLGYALTVHKSQGSEEDSVLFVLPDDPFLLSKELFYTGVTRAKTELVLLGKKASISGRFDSQYACYSDFPFLRPL